MRTTSVLAATAALLAIGAGPAAAKPEVKSSSAKADGNRAVVSGTAAFPAISGPQSVKNAGTTATVADVAATAPGDTVTDAAGLKITDARVTPLEDGSGLRFQLQLANMPQEVPPDGVSWRWGFEVGGAAFQLSAKRTNMGSLAVTEDPIGFAEHAIKNEGFFQLRGACGTYRGAINGCFHLMFLKGSFNTAAKTITWDLPYDPRDSIGRRVASQFAPGAVVQPSFAGGTEAIGEIAASMGATLSLTATSRGLKGTSPIFLGPQVGVAVGKASAKPETLTYAPAQLAADGTFTGTATGLTNDARTAFVRACNGTECAYGSAPVS